MPIPDVFDFAVDDLAGYDPEWIDRALEEHPVLYLNHLRIARHMQDSAQQLAEHPAYESADSNEGYVQALREVAAHLRQGNYLPDGVFLRR
jgi:hypothetical protein